MIDPFTMGRYCTYCERLVEPEKKFSWGYFLITLFLTLGIGTVIYLIYWGVKTPITCPICNAKTIAGKPKEVPSQSA